jgi:uncharacterized protein
VTASPLAPVLLADLRRLAEGKTWQVDQPIAGLDSLTPVRGVLSVIHHGTALEAKSQVEAIVTLICARCLLPFNHALRADVRELMDFRGDAVSPLEATTLAPAMDLDDRQDPHGWFDPEQWLFEQLSLRLPLVNRCGADCPGPACWGSAPPTIDPRWAALRALSSPPSSPTPP